MMLILGILAAGHMHGPVIFGADKDWLLVVAPYLVMIDCVEAMKIALSSGCPVVALACKRCSKQHLDLGKCAKWRHATHFCPGCSHKWDVTQ